MDAVTRYFLNPGWSASADSPAFPGTISERMVRAHLTYVGFRIFGALEFSISHRSAVLEAYRPDNELGVFTIVESVQPTGVSPRYAFRQRLLTIALETIMCHSRVSK